VFFNQKLDISFVLDQRSASRGHVVGSLAGKSYIKTNAEGGNTKKDKKKKKRKEKKTTKQTTRTLLPLSLPSFSLPRCPFPSNKHSKKQHVLNI
jgi:hypothetical protein